MCIYIYNKLYKKNIEANNGIDHFFAFKSTLLTLLWLYSTGLG